MSNVFNDQVIFNSGTQTFGNSSVSGDLEVVGVITATSYYGDGSQLNGLSVTVNQQNYSGVNPVTTSGTVVTIGSTSNAYGTRYISVGSTPGGSSLGSNGDIWYTI